LRSPDFESGASASSASPARASEYHSARAFPYLPESISVSAGMNGPKMVLKSAQTQRSVDDSAGLNAT
jgi:hypothetical protein